MGKNAEYLARMEALLKGWDADVDALAVAGEKAGAKAAAVYRERVKGLRASRDAAQETLQQARIATESAGAQMRAAMQTAWESMQRALANVSSELGQLAAAPASRHEARDRRYR